ncbi:glycoside hydrolase family 43 protein [Neptunicella marina]|uniref:Glycoside hydrolase family 43 protein n=1 Tax=Neptunicella marina TaxID=2125989 RepID=A0A8J6M3I5_9ALTE|nr:glycoside hydrolase family 43 protein [Neptunicella marina]MBC3765426.1 glycoside hydrolase family 43 protein [Neptunicella marina]
MLRVSHPLFVATVMLIVSCLSGCGDKKVVDNAASIKVKPVASFNWFEYQGNDKVFGQPLKADEFYNPVISGFFPDPSITRKGDDYYLTTSSFSYAPGLPVLHSKDLVNWQLIGHALNRNAQFNFDGLRVSRGIFAPTIRYHDGLFYIITTAVDSGGNFIITAEDPAGPWSGPIWLPEVGGIDPDIFFDDNGKVYITHNDAPAEKPRYDGHRAIWMWEYDPATQKVVKDSGHVVVNGGTDISKKPIWIEAPHLYKINGWYYLMCAQGGTGDNHSEVIFRSRSLEAPFEPYANNPILTQRDLDPNRAQPVTTAGHADLIQTPAGDWWAVFLATRSYEQRFYNTGRETFLLPVSWNNDWPTILAKGDVVPYVTKRPNLDLFKPADAVPQTGNFVWRDDFEQTNLDLNWSWLRQAEHSWSALENGQLTLTAQPANLNSLNQPAFIGHRQQHMHFTASAELVLPESTEIETGLTAFQNSQYHYDFGLSKMTGGYHLLVRQMAAGIEQKLANIKIVAEAGDTIRLSITANAGKMDFSYSLADNQQPFLKDTDGKILSTTVAGGFVGTMVGPYSQFVKNGEK